MLPVPNRQNTLGCWLDYLMSIHPTTIDMGLERVSCVAKKLGVTTFGDTKVVTVAGTNGKGTTCAMIEQIMTQAGWRVGVYSSPHLLDYNERVRIAGTDVSDSTLVAAFWDIEQAREQISLTFFEVATLAGLIIFKAAKLDLILLEVGLGGRLDATNIIDADIGVITSIDIDHQDYLGNTRSQIGFEKAGIFRTNRPAIIGEPNLPVSVIAFIDEIGAQPIKLGDDFHYTKSGEYWNYYSSTNRFTELSVPQLPLENAVTALAVVEQLVANISQTVVQQGLQKARLAGRLEVVSEKPKIILDVAHNPHAAKYLQNYLAVYTNRRIIGLCGMLDDKDHQGVIDALTTQIDVWYFTNLDCVRSASAQQLMQCLTSTDTGYPFESMAQAWTMIQGSVRDDDIVIVFGSFYTVAAFKQLTTHTLSEHNQSEG